MLTMDPKMSICSSEISHLTGRKSAVECVETIAEHLETQMLVESIMKTRPKTPPPLDVNVIPTRKEIEAQEQAKIEQAKSQQQSGILVASICPCNKSCCNEKCETCPMKEPADLKLPHDYEKKCEGKSKIQNAIPQKWESTMVSALRTTPDRPYCITPDNLSQIPQKHSTTALASALSIAPSEPFNPVGLLYSKDPVPLPEETVPYLPPERPIIPAEPKVKETRPEVAASPFVEALKTAPDRPFTPVGGAPTRKKKPAPDPLLKDLPKSQEKLSMLSALTTASERTYSPFITEFQTMQIKEKEEQVKKEQAWECRKACIKQPQAPKPFISTMVNTFEGDDNRSVQGHFPPVSVELQQSCEESYEQRQSYAHIEERMEHREMKQEMEVQSKSKQFAEVKKEEIARQSEEVIMKKPLNVASQLHKSEYLPQYQTSLEYAEEIQLPHHKNINKLLNPNKPKDPIIKPVTTIMPGQQNPNISQSCFQPVHEDFTPPNSAFSQRVAQPATPSMINKPPSAIPYYQQNLVATEFLAPEVCLYDPKSPAVSRSPSPCPGGQRSVSPFRKSSPRPKSPAPGPPPNPLHVLNTSTATDSFRDIKKEQAKESVTSYIPQHREKLQQIQQHESAGQSVSVAPTGTCSNKMQQQYQADHSQMSQLQSYEAAQRALAAKSEMSKQMVQANYQQKDYRAQEYLAASAEKHSLSQQGNQTVAISEKSKAEQLQQLNKSEVQSVQTSADNRVQIQRKKTVTEEFEHTHKEKVIEIEKSSTGVKTHPFQKVNAPVVDDQPGIIGLHVTNPHPLVSPFHKTQNIQAPKPPSYQVSKSNVAPASVPPPAPVQKVPPPMPSKINVPIVPPLSGAGPSSANKLNVNPNVPAPSVGSGSGRQTGSVFAPKRGRGVLNVGGMVGARLALCGHCHQQIRGPFITALGKIWCPDHFTCATPSCKRPLQDIGFVEEKGQLHCEYCFEQYLAPNCSKCGIKIKGDCLKAIGRNFHPECFNCTHCGKLFANSPFFLEDGLPYCEADWNEMFTTKCFACGFPVEAGDRWVEALNNNYHSQCFNCTMCKKNLEGQSFFAKGGRPFCKNHAR
ncbi:PREDICTED: PDZ and LIM domain protein Zasp isoform X1 [Nicrophorus vespilloides]|uniref:PDZ and LIM domain protein Zasp isoform X1 n=1 Tax=Nicrophorus vespilloides TaxID=110193 RepID=A0ABM1MGW5_NICVS|nr:PREDICTED: PDZ and LIM domain protein Zasp isoform X1 [Nicrophorus vespilloides]